MCYTSVTGISTTVEDLRERVERIWTLYRPLNLKDGSAAELDEDIPQQWRKAGGFKEYVSERPLSRAAVMEMIGDYNEEWGWNRESGVPSQQLLESLGLANR